ncbi:hypothetical protein [Reinekea sp. G2M2-21]|uniref:hypothetical protein n=1 Tax=Reinekea sp. G2M2-21 TaxID=2788942 RepID=UPI0018AAA5B2|nr:hypothetical protein [Reinekea sp. G2M2-21]
MVSLGFFTTSNGSILKTKVLFLTKRFIGGFLFSRGDPLAPPSVARFGILPCQTLSSNGRLSVRPCTHGAFKGIHALESIAMCLSCQPKQMRRSSYLHLIGLISICWFEMVIKKPTHAVGSSPFKRPFKDEVEKIDQSFVAAGVVKNQARIVGLVWPLTAKNRPVKLSQEMMQIRVSNNRSA